MKPAGSQERPRWSPNVQREQKDLHPQKTLSFSHKNDRDSGHCINSSQREGSNASLTVEDISGLDTGYDADVEVVNPYIYEDADSDSNTPSRVRQKSIVDFDHLWKHELVDSMKSLDCNSEKDDDSMRMPFKRGVKRKPKDTAEKLRRSEAQSVRGSPFEVVEIDYGTFSPKKPRKGKKLETQDGFSRSAATKATSDESSSAQPLSTEGSRGSSEPEDPMDIDRASH